MSNELRSLREKVESLADEAGEIRNRLLNCLDVAARRHVDALGLARGVAETLTKQVLAAIGIAAPGMLDACLRELEKPETMSRGLVPAEIIAMLHKVRTIGNKALHDALRIEVTADDVTSVLGDVLRVVRWYFGEFARGPRLDLVFRSAPAKEMESPRGVQYLRGRQAGVILKWASLLTIFLAALLLFTSACFGYPVSLRGLLGIGPQVPSRETDPRVVPQGGPILSNPPDGVPNVTIEQEKRPEEGAKVPPTP